MKRYRFFYHYRRSTQGMTVHFRGQCLPCKDVVCKVPCETKWNNDQPRLVLQGFAANVNINDNTATIS